MRVSGDLISVYRYRPKSTISRILGANTARNVQEIIIEDKIDGFFDEVVKEACEQMRQHSEWKIPVEVILFDFDGTVLSRDKKE